MIDAVCFLERGQLPPGQMPGPPVGILNAGRNSLHLIAFTRLKGSGCLPPLVDGEEEEEKVTASRSTC